VDQRVEFVSNFLVELCNRSGNHHSLKAPYIINSQNAWSRSKKIGIFLTRYTVTKNTLGVPNNLLYVQKVF